MSRSADAFLRAFRGTLEDGRGLEVIADNAEGFAAALASEPEALAQAIDDASAGAGGAASVSASAFATASCRRDGRIVAGDAAFAAFDLPTSALAKVLQIDGSGPPRLSAIVDDVRGRPVALAVAAPPRALAWPLDPGVREALVSGAADFGILCVRSADGIDWPALFSAWTFSGAETRLASALVRRGDLREAASESGVTYETARGTLAAAMAKTGARRQPDFVRQLAQLAFGDLPTNDATWRTLADTYGLTARQGRLALLIAFGATRAAAGASLGISDQTAKADLKLIHDSCGVENGAALGRLVAETDALARLATATDVEILGPTASLTPLRFVRRRRSAGRIAVEDHGPYGATPVVIFHTPTSGRHLPRVLVHALQRRDLRPISVERPGFGLTTASDGDFVEDANADLIDVLDALELSRVCLLGRSVAMPLRFAAAHPERVERGVLLSATPPGTRAVIGLMATFMDLALDHPRMAQSFARMGARLSSERSILRITERTVGKSPADMTAISDPKNRADWVRASRQSSSGDGFAREFVLHADGGSIPPQALAIDWTVLAGAQDNLADGVADVTELWRAAMPRARFRLIADAGRLLHLSHPDAIADALTEGRRPARSTSP